MCPHLLSLWTYGYLMVFGDAVHVLCCYLQDSLDMFRHSYVYLAFCAINKPHTKVVMHSDLTDV